MCSSDLGAAGRARTIGEAFPGMAEAAASTATDYQAVIDKLNDKNMDTKLAHAKFLAEADAGRRKEAYAAYDKFSDNANQEAKFREMIQQYYAPVAQSHLMTARAAQQRAASDLGADKLGENALRSQAGIIQKQIDSLTKANKFPSEAVKGQINLLTRQLDAINAQLSQFTKGAKVATGAAPALTPGAVPSLESFVGG